MKIIVFIQLYVCYKFAASEEDGAYSYFKFRGPVSGQIREVLVPHANRPPTIDYVAKPDYTYSFGVKDPDTGNSQDRQESRNGDSVQGQYSVLEADGSVRIVRYTADPKHGFQATVEYAKS